MERGIISRDKKGLAECSQVLIFSKGISSWLWLVSMLGVGDVGVYIASSILKSDYVGLQDMEITHYDSMSGVMKDVSNGLLDKGLCLLQGTFSFVVEVTIILVTEILDISILGVASGRHFKGYKILRNFQLTRKYQFRLFYIVISEG